MKINYKAGDYMVFYPNGSEVRVKLTEQEVKALFLIGNKLDMGFEYIED